MDHEGEPRPADRNVEIQCKVLVKWVPPDQFLKELLTRETAGLPSHETIPDDDDLTANFNIETTGRIRFTSRDHRFLRALKIAVDLEVDEEPLIELAPSIESIEVLSVARRLLDEALVQHESLLVLTPLQFEEVVAEIFSRLGYTVELTKRTRDGGRDIVAVKRADIEIRLLIECKRYRPERRVDVSLVRALYGVKISERATKALLATTSTFTRDAQNFIHAHKWEMEGRDYSGILEWIKTVRNSNR